MVRAVAQEAGPRRTEAGLTAAAAASARSALGVALGLRAEECADTVDRRLREKTWLGRIPSRAYLDLVHRIRWLGTVMIARWLYSGVSSSPEEMAYIGERGEIIATEQLSIVNMQRAYFLWRDTCWEILRQEATRLGTPAEVLTLALDMVAISCESSLLRVGGSFDRRLHSLAEQLRAERETLEQHAFHDQLTGLPNRVLLYDRLQQALLSSRRGGREFAVVLLDLDGFKTVNDNLGHSYGDGVLQETARRLLTAVRDVDTVARLGGDEFVAVLLSTDRIAARAIGTRMLEALKPPMEIEGRMVCIDASLGIATHPLHGDSARSLLSAADAAMYAVKRRSHRVTAAGPRPRGHRHGPVRAAAVALAPSSAEPPARLV